MAVAAYTTSLSTWAMLRTGSSRGSREPRTISIPTFTTLSAASAAMTIM